MKRRECAVNAVPNGQKKLLLLDGVTGAHANYKKGIIMVETTLPDEALASCVQEAGFSVTLIRERKGLFG